MTKEFSFPSRSRLADFLSEHPACDEEVQRSQEVEEVEAVEALSNWELARKSLRGGVFGDRAGA